MNKILEKNKTILPKFPDLLNVPTKTYCEVKFSEEEIKIKNELLKDENKLKHIHYCCNNLLIRLLKQ